MYVLGYLQSAHLFDIEPLHRQVTNLAQQTNTFTRTNVHNFARMNVHEHIHSVFPPIEQASAFTFAGRISARSSILTLPIGWRGYLK